RARASAFAPRSFVTSGTLSAVACMGTVPACRADSRGLRDLTGIVDGSTPEMTDTSRSQDLRIHQLWFRAPSESLGRVLKVCRGTPDVESGVPMTDTRALAVYRLASEHVYEKTETPAAVTVFPGAQPRRLRCAAYAQR